MIRIERTNSGSADFTNLVKFLDRELAERDGEDHQFYAQFNKLDKIKHVVLSYYKDLPVACGAMKEFQPGIMEIKRMFTKEEYRGKGLASHILSELEKWSTELSYNHVVLETGIRQPEAIHLYKKSGFIIIPNYGQYAGVETSICFEKILTAK